MIKTIDQKHLSMAYQIKSNAKLGVEESFISLKTGDVSTEEFEGYQWVIESQKVYEICAKNDLDIDDEKLINLIARSLENLQMVLTSIGSM